MFTSHTIDAYWNGTGVVVNPETVKGTFLDSFIWRTTDDDVSLTFPGGHPFLLQNVTGVHNPHPHTPASGTPYVALNPFKRAYDYQVTVVVGGKAHSRDPKVIIDSGTGGIVVAAALVVTGLALWVLKNLLWRR